ncbi:MAG: SLOG family protein, partial [Massilioclostridium sp.]|nr:SLOG family protein [Massilioclostridium sp.]
MKNQTCCFTGHRDLPPQKLPYIQKRLEQELLQLIHQGVRYFGAGGALGFDTLAALTVLRLRETYP